jgi:hypothetical protein
VRRHLGADAGGDAGDNGVGDADGVGAEFLELGGEACGGDLVADHHRDDRMVAGEHVEAEFDQAGTEVGCVLAQAVAQVG